MHTRAPFSAMTSAYARPMPLAPPGHDDRLALDVEHLVKRRHLSSPVREVCRRLSVPQTPGACDGLGNGLRTLSLH